MGLENHQLSIHKIPVSQPTLAKEKGIGKLTVKDTVQIIKSEVEIQEQKIKMSLIGRGKWSLAPQYKQFGVSLEVY